MDKIAILLKQKEKLFHTADLAVLWKISNLKTLYQTIYRLVKKGILFRVQKGFYSVVPLGQINPINLGFRAINSFAYLSTESVLSMKGVINQPVNKITFVSSFSDNFVLEENIYLVRQLKVRSLHNTLGITEDEQGFLVANLERAVVDMLYFRPQYHFDGVDLINWNLVKNYKKQIYD
jgi:predicted transcriptional regulator of viral defense system